MKNKNVDMNERLKYKVQEIFKIYSNYPPLMDLMKIIGTTGNYMKLIQDPELRQFEIPVLQKPLSNNQILKRAEKYCDIIIEIEEIVKKEDDKIVYEYQTFYFEFEQIKTHCITIQDLFKRIDYLNYILKEYKQVHFPKRERIFLENFNLKAYYEKKTFIEYHQAMKQIIDTDQLFFNNVALPIIDITFVEKILLEINYLYEKLNLKLKNPESESGQIVYQLPDSFVFKNDIVRAEKLKSIQLGILFNYLRDFQVIGDFEDSSLAKLVHYLTGWGAETLRKDFTSYYDFKKKEFKGKKNDPHHFSKVKEVLQEIIETIDISINEIEQKSK